MRRRSHRQNLVVWSSSAGLGYSYDARRLPMGRRRARRWLRAGAVLTVMGLMRLGRVARKRWRAGLLAIGGLLTVIGVTLSSGTVFVPGLMILVFALLKGSRAPVCPAAAQLAGMRWHG